jgi:hypothetical protein
LSQDGTSDGVFRRAGSQPDPSHKYEELDEAVEEIIAFCFDLKNQVPSRDNLH